MGQFVSPRIFFGEGALDNLGEIEGTKAFIVTDKLMVELGYLQRVQKLLNMDSVVFDEVEPDPSFETVLKAREMIFQQDIDIIIGLGGGSPMDVAKTVRILYEMPDFSLEDLESLPFLPLKFKKTRLILIPTTSGTGAEVTPAIVLTDTKNGRKVPTVNFNAISDTAIVDPSLVLALPPQLTANTGMDALSHAIDSYISQWKNDFSDGLSIQAAKMIFEYLPKSFKDGSDVKAREKMHTAASIAGLAFGNAQAGLSHGLGHSLGAVFHFPHGKACGISLPYSLLFEAKDPEVFEFLVELSHHLGIKGKGEQAVKGLIKKICELMKILEMPISLSEAGISREDFQSQLPKLVENAERDGTTVTIRRMPDSQEFQKLFECLYEGKKVDF